MSTTPRSLPFSPYTPLTLAQAMGHAERMDGRQMLGWLMFLASQTQRNTYLILKELQTMSTTAVSREQFDAGLTNLLQAEAQRDTAVLQAFSQTTTALDDLVAKVNAGAVPPEDFAAELASVQKLNANAVTLAQTAAQITQTATSDDPGPVTVTAAPSPAPNPPSASGSTAPTATADGSASGSTSSSASSSAAPAPADASTPETAASQTAGS